MSLVLIPEHRKRGASHPDPAARSGRLPLLLSTAVPILLYLALALSRIGMPYTDDEVWEAQASSTLLEQGVPLDADGNVNMFHPHGYYRINTLAMRLLGKGETGTRAVGLAATVACFLVLVRVLGRIPGARSPSMVLLGCLFLLAPVVVQGSLIVTADTALHHLLLTLFLAYAAKRPSLRLRDQALLACLFAVSLWCKIVTPCFAAGALVLYLLLRRRWREACLAAAVVGIGGFLIFFLTWMAYAGWNGQDGLKPFTYLLGVLQSRSGGPGPSAKLLAVARGTTTLLFWLGPAYAILMPLAAWRALRGPGAAALGLFATAGIVILVAHTLVSGVAFGYPRYHYAMHPLWALTIVGALASGSRGALSGRTRLWIAAFAASCALYLGLLAGDPLLALNRTLKEALAGLPGTAPPAKYEALRVVALVCLPTAAALGLWLLRRLPLVPALLAVAVATNLAMDGIQLRAPYHTGLAYGEEGTREVIARISPALPPDGEVLAGKDIVLYTGGRRFMQDWKWAEEDYLLGRIGDPRTRFVVLGLLHNTQDQLRRMFLDGRFRSALEADYALERIGTYFLWARKSP